MKQQRKLAEYPNALCVFAGYSDHGSHCGSFAALCNIINISLAILGKNWEIKKIHSQRM